MTLGRRATAEFFGTFWLVFGGCGAAVLDAAFPSLGIGFVGVALAFGLTVLTMAFAMKFTAPGTLYIGVDGFKEQFKGNTHLVRFSVAPDHLAWDEHHGGPESKHAVGEAMKAARAAKR